MREALTGSWALFLGVALLMLGHGLQGSLLGLRATLEGFPTALTGIVMSAYFAGFLAGSVLAPRAVRRVGHVRVFAALASLVSTAALMHAVFVNPATWVAMRVLTGVCLAGLYVVAESWLNDRATNETRGQVLSIYMVIMTGGLGGGQLLLNLADPAGFELFILTSALVSLALVPMLLSASPAPAFDAPAQVGIRQLYAMSPLGVIGCMGTGLSTGAVVGMGAVYAEGIGLSLAQISLFMAMAFLGAVVFQWPIGQVSDRFDRRRVLTIVTFLAAAAATAAALAGAGGWAPFVIMCIFGGLAFPMYALCIAHTNDFLEPEQMVAASSGLVFAGGAGAIFGPVTVAATMSIVGPAGFFWCLAAVHAAIGAFALWRMTRRPAMPLDEQGTCVILTRTSAVATAAAVETALGQMDEEGEGAAG